MGVKGTQARAVAALATLTLLLCAAPASADEQITAGPPNRYLTSEVTIDQGERVTFTNTDVAEHDVLARDAGPDGKPLFRSELVGAGNTVPVEGVEYLTTGNYAFFCSLHPQMEGTITVTAAGTPVPRPSGPGPGTGPSLALRVLDKRVGAVKRRGALRVRVTTGGPATVRMTARAKGSAFAKGTTKFTSAKTSTVRLKLSRAGRRLVRRGGRIAVKVNGTATDGQGQKTKGSAKTTLR